MMTMNVTIVEYYFQLYHSRTKLVRHSDGNDSLGGCNYVYGKGTIMMMMMMMMMMTPRKRRRRRRRRRKLSSKEDYYYSHVGIVSPKSHHCDYL